MDKLESLNISKNGRKYSSTLPLQQICIELYPTAHTFHLVLMSGLERLDGVRVGRPHLVHGDTVFLLQLEDVRLM